MQIDRSKFIESLGGAETVEKMTDEQRADALEDFRSAQLDKAPSQQKRFPTVAEIADKIETRSFRRGAGKLLVQARDAKSGSEEAIEPVVRRLPPMPPKPTLEDFFELRFAPAAHLLQSAALAKKSGASDDVVLACLLHDAGSYLMKADHGYWGAQIVEPYVSEKTAFAIRYHQALRFFPDPAVGYEYPEIYGQFFGRDYSPPAYIRAAYDYARNHKWYMQARLVTLNDLYAFDPDVEVSIDEFRDIIGRCFKQPEEGLGYDGSPVSHMWRSMVNPDAPL